MLTYRSQTMHRTLLIASDIKPRKARPTFILGWVRVDEGEVGRVLSRESVQGCSWRKGESCRVSSPAPPPKSTGPVRLEERRQLSSVVAILSLLCGVLAWKLKQLGKP